MWAIPAEPYRKAKAGLLRRLVVFRNVTNVMRWRCIIDLNQSLNLLWVGVGLIEKLKNTAMTDNQQFNIQK